MHSYGRLSLKSPRNSIAYGLFRVRDEELKLEGVRCTAYVRIAAGANVPNGAVSMPRYV